jgi:hypothetical protein
MPTTKLEFSHASLTRSMARFTTAAMKTSSPERGYVRLKAALVRLGAVQRGR